jgi:Uncharacterised nucleotidyltransferase
LAAQDTPNEANEGLARVWESVDSLLARATLRGILAHKVGPLAAQRLRRLGEPVPPPLALEGRAAMLCMLTVIPLLERVRSSCNGELVLMKGPEIARLYPKSGRRFADIDILVEDAQAVRMGLVRGGFDEIVNPGYSRVWHELEQTFSFGSIELEVDVHKTAHWPWGLRRPPSLTREVLEAAVPSTLGVAGISTPAPHHHALLLAAHAWAHEPLWTLQDLIDVAVVSAYADDRDLKRTAAAWEMSRLWQTTRQTIEAVFYDGRTTIPLRTWARHLGHVRERTALEGTVTQLAQGYWGTSRQQGVKQTMGAMRYLMLTRARRARRYLGGLVGRRDPH